MSTTDNAIKVLNETLQALEAGLNGRTSEINKAYTDAEKTAKKTYDAAIATAKKTKEEALLEFSSEKAEIGKLKNAIKALTGSTAKATPAKNSERVGGWDEKITAALAKLGKTIADKPAPKEISATLTALYPDVTFNTGSLNAAWNKYKKDHQ